MGYPCTGKHEGPFSVSQLCTYADLKAASQQTVEVLTGENVNWDALVATLIGFLSKKGLEAEKDVIRFHRKFVGEPVYTKG